MSLKFSLIFPAYNEEARLKKLNILPDYHRYLTTLFGHDFSLLVVVNGSSDRTLAIVQEMAMEFPSIRAIEIKEKGKGRAIIAGLYLLDASVVGYADIDGAVQPVELDKLLQFIPEYDVVIGSRSLPDSILDPRPPLSRKINSYFASLIVRSYCGLDLHDPFCGFKLIKRDAVVRLLPQLKAAGLAIDINLLYAAKQEGLRIKEVAIRWSYVEGSKINFSSNFYYLEELFRIKHQYCRIPKA